MLHDVYKKAPDVAYRDIDDQLVLVSARRGVIFTLNSVGAFIWAAMDGTSSAEAVAEAVQVEFQVDEPTARADTLEFLEGLRAEGLIEQGAAG